MSTLVAASSPTTPSRRDRAGDFVGLLLRTPTFVVGTAILLWWVVAAVAWRWIAPYNPNAVDTLASLQSPSGAHWFGTDDLGRDVFSRVLAGSASVLTVATSATVFGIVAGVVIGLVTGYYRGVVDSVMMRIVDATLAFPVVITAVLVLAVLGRSRLNLIVVIAVVFTPAISRTVRSAVLVEREHEYVAAARLRGERGGFIMFAEVLPNITGPIAVEATVRLGYAVFTVGTLSFLGFGLQPPSPDWGLAVANGRAFLQIAPHIVLFPALALASLVIAVNLAADGLSQVADQ